MKNFKEINILGYGEGRGLAIDEDGFISSKDIETIGKIYGRTTPVKQLIRQKPILTDILISYLNDVCMGELPIEGDIAVNYTKLLNENNLDLNVESVNKIKLTREYIKEILKEYYISKGRYSGSRLLESLPGFVRKHNYGGTVGKVVFYNKMVSLILASVYDISLRNKIYGFYASHNIVSNEEIEHCKEVSTTGSMVYIRLKKLIYTNFKDQNDRDRVMVYINEKIRDVIGRKYDLGKYYAGKGYPSDYSNFRILCQQVLFNHLRLQSKANSYVENEHLTKRVIDTRLGMLRPYHKDYIPFMDKHLRQHVELVEKLRTKHSI